MTGPKPGWWNHTPQRDWTQDDWRDWRRHGSPRLPPKMRPGGDDPPPITAPYAAPLHTVPAGFTMFPRRHKARDAHGQAIDKLLAKHLGRR